MNTTLAGVTFLKCSSEASVAGVNVMNEGDAVPGQFLRSSAQSCVRTSSPPCGAPLVGLTHDGLKFWPNVELPSWMLMICARARQPADPAARAPRPRTG